MSLNMNRIKKAAEKMATMGMDQLVISDPVTIFYLTNTWIHTGERMLAMLMDKAGNCQLFVHEMFHQADDFGMPVTYFSDVQSPVAVMNEAVIKSGTLGIDKYWPSRFLLGLQEINTTIKYVNGSFAVDSVRMQKDADEVAKMVKASDLNDESMGMIQALIAEGKSELFMIEELKEIYKKIGADGLSFDPIICYGANAAEPHHSCDDSTVKPGDSVIIDIGCLKDNYCSDMTRTVFYKSASEEAVKVYNIVKEANEKAIAAVRPGVRFCDIDRAARSVIEEAGYGEFFTHRTGHSIGLEVHDFGDVSSINEAPVAEGMIFSIEPGIYLKNNLGVRIEDLVLVTKDGCQVLNNYSKELKIIG